MERSRPFASSSEVLPADHSSSQSARARVGSICTPRSAAAATITLPASGGENNVSPQSKSTPRMGVTGCDSDGPARSIAECVAMRVAILGVGRLGAFHAKVLSETKDVDELRVYDADGARAKEIATTLHVRAAATIDEALAGVDTAVIVTPTNTHASLIKRCLDARIATFCEKPIAIGIPETRDIVAHVERAKGRLQIGFQRRFADPLALGRGRCAAPRGAALPDVLRSLRWCLPRGARAVPALRARRGRERLHRGGRARGAPHRRGRGPLLSRAADRDALRD